MHTLRLISRALVEILRIPLLLALLGVDLTIGVGACVFFGILYGQTGLIVALIVTQSWLIALIIRNWHRQYKITKRILENRQVSQEDYNKAMEYIVKEAEKQKD